jgi:hypothetical protein
MPGVPVVRVRFVPFVLRGVAGRLMGDGMLRVVMV